MGLLKRHKLAARVSRRELRGNVALITAISIVMLCAFAALAVDVGNQYRVRSQQRAALDAAALAAAGQLNGTTNGMNNARAAAIAQAQLHRVDRANLVLTASDISFGTWGPGFAATQNPDFAVAVRIEYTGPVSNSFGAVLGNRTSRIGTHAIAIGGGPVQPACPFPMAVASCAMRDATQGDNCGYCMYMQDAQTDTAGWTTFNQGPVSRSNLFPVVSAACPSITADGVCAATCATRLEPNQLINLGNGNNFNTGNDSFCEVIQNLLMRNGSPQSFKVTVPVLNVPGSPCNPSFTGSQPITGYAELTIFGAQCSNNNNARRVLAPNPLPQINCAPSSGKFMIATLDCRGTRVNSVTNGGQFWGALGRPRLVE